MSEKKAIIKVRKIDKEQYYVHCPKCSKEIVGNSENDVAFNLGIHLEKHKRDEEKMKEKENGKNRTFKKSC